MNIKSRPTKTYHFSTTLIAKLAKILENKLTLVTAPMGYGKTTSIREYFGHQPSVHLLWQNVLSESLTDFWVGFCEAFYPVHPELAKKLLEMGFPQDPSTQREFLRTVMEIYREEETFVLVIDDYHLVDVDAVYKFLAFLYKYAPDNFHLVLCSRHLILRPDSELIFSQDILSLTAEDLAFTPQDILRYFHKCGAIIYEEKAEQIYQRSEGWISLIYLYLVEYLEHGDFSAQNDIDILIDQRIFLPLPEQHRALLCQLSVFPDFTLEQAGFMADSDTAQEILGFLYKRGAFLTFSRQSGKYRFHSILQKCLYHHFGQLSPEQQRSIQNQAGHWCRKTGEYLAAMDYYYAAENFSGLWEVLIQDRGNSIDGEHQEKLIQYYEHCPPEIRREYPLAILNYGMNLYTFNDLPRFSAVCQEFMQVMETRLDIPEAERNHLLGEYEMLISFTHYNDILAMSQHHKKAAQLMQSESYILDNQGSWTFGSPSILLLYYRKSGELDEEVAQMIQSMPYYSQVTNGHGFGAELVMQAEMYWNRNEVAQAEIFAHKGLDAAMEKKQWGIAICAVFLQVRIALFTGNFEAAQELLEKYRGQIQEKGLYLYLHTLDVCEAWMYTLLAQPKLLPEWLVSGDFTHTRILFPALPALQILFGQILLLREEYTRLISKYETFSEMSNLFPNLLAQIYLQIQMAGAYQKLGQKEEALNYLEQALNLAMPDQLYMPFVENGSFIQNLLKQHGTKGIWAKEVKLILDFIQMYQNKFTQINRSNCMDNGFGLTPREWEIALLVVQGFSNKKIAETLFIAESTVKYNLWIVFQKLNINSRTKLINIITGQKKDRKNP